MVIRDKQELKRCVKQAVRRAQVTETRLCFDVNDGTMGVGALLETWAAPSGAPSDALRRACEGETPFCEDAGAMFAALSALELPTHNLNNAQTIQESYDRPAYLREVLDAMRARRVLVCVDVQEAELALFDDDRLSPMLLADGASFFAPTRYGIHYEERVNVLAAKLASCGARDLCAQNVSADALRYALVPLSEDTGCVLHLHAGSEAALTQMMEILQAHAQARAVISCLPSNERRLIDWAKGRSRVRVCLGGFENMRYALSALGTRFVPFSSGAALPEQMLGRWEIARETIWQTLLDAYLPLARAGYELTSEAIARDVENLLGGSLESLYSK